MAEINKKVIRLEIDGKFIGEIQDTGDVLKNIEEFEQYKKLHGIYEANKPAQAINLQAFTFGKIAANLFNDQVEYFTGTPVNMRIISRFAAKLLIFTCLFAASQTAQAGEKITIAAAADLKFALDEIVALFNKAHPADQVETIYGSSGKFQAQIRQGAPFDLYFSADIAYPRALKEKGFAASEVQPYALGRIVLWSPSRDAVKMTLADLADPAIQKIAIANPKHAPYGKRAEEALKASGVWEKVEAKLVYGENVAQAAQFVQTGNAQAGIIALSLALSPELARQRSYALISDRLHQPLEQGFIVTKRAADNPLAQAFASFMVGKETRAVMTRYGFVLPGDAK